jgi:NAD(P)-dependent dehydrogenase (short-subunit alcohol dehydrogenase family)
MKQYQQMWEKSINDPDAFWLEQAKSISWFKEPTESLRYTWDVKNRIIEHTWFADGQLNVSYNCLDRHLGTPTAKKTAIIWQGEPENEVRVLTYQQLHTEVSKFANVLFTYELARRLEGTGVTANALHPGLVLTNIARRNGRLIGWSWRLYARRHGALTPEEGAANVLFVASSPALDGVTGAYFFKSARADSAPGTEDSAAAGRLWQASVRMTGAPWAS